MKADVVLLPGLHGSAMLFETFIALAPPWAQCVPVSLPVKGDQSFDSLADQLERRLRSLKGFVLFAESFAGPVAARLAQRLGSKVALLVLCNPLVEAPILIAPSLMTSFLRWGIVPQWAAAFALTGGDREIAASVSRELRALPREVLQRRLAVVASADRQDLLERLAAPLLVITGSEDRLLSPAMIERVLKQVPYAVQASVEAPHLAAQVAPAAVWAAITAEFESAA